MANIPHGAQLFKEFLAAEPRTPAEALSEKLWLRWRNQVSPEQAREARQVGEADFYFELAAGEPS